MKREELYDEASIRVRMLGEFYQHLGAYLMFNAGLGIYNLVIGEIWFLYSLLGWGIALVAHAAGIFASGWLSYWIRMYLPVRAYNVIFGRLTEGDGDNESRTYYKSRDRLRTHLSIRESIKSDERNDYLTL